jgi:hypothetical protein
MTAHRSICGQIIVPGGGGLVCRLSGSLDRKRDGHRGGFSRSTAPLFPLKAAGVRADFRHEKKKKREGWSFVRSSRVTVLYGRPPERRGHHRVPDGRALRISQKNDERGVSWTKHDRGRSNLTRLGWALPRTFKLNERLSHLGGLPKKMESGEPHHHPKRTGTRQK